MRTALIVVPAPGFDDCAAGIEEAGRRALLTKALFGVRARVVTGAMQASHTRSFVSGLLIGAELLAALDMMGSWRGTVVAIAAPKLQGHYAVAAARLGIELSVLDPDAVYRAALSVFFDRIA